MKQITLTIYGNEVALKIDGQVDPVETIKVLEDVLATINSHTLKYIIESTNPPIEYFKARKHLEKTIKYMPGYRVIIPAIPAMEKQNIP